MLTQLEYREVLDRFQQFVRLPAEQRLEYFSFKAPAMCSDEWRKKIEQLLREGSRVNQEIFREIFDHVQLSVIDGQDAVSACRQCRTALWQLVWLSTDVDGH